MGGRACGGDTVPLFRAPIPTMKKVYIYNTAAQNLTINYRTVDDDNDNNDDEYNKSNEDAGRGRGQ